MAQLALDFKPIDRALTPMEHRAKYARDPRRVTGCSGCESYGLCLYHSLPIDSRPAVRERNVADLSEGGS